MSSTTVSGKRGSKSKQAEWTDRIITLECVGYRDPPQWARDAHKTFADAVTDPNYPCYFGTAAEIHGDLYYAFVNRCEDDKLWALVGRFVEVYREAQEASARRNLVVFCEPELVQHTHEHYRQRLWRMLQSIHDQDPCQDLDLAVTHPSDPLWEFPFMGVLFFVVGAAPSYVARRSRNLGPGMIMIFQPRDVFIDLQTGEPISEKVRQIIRRRGEAWDGIGPHPDLGVYSHTANREWKQYFLTDDGKGEARECPFQPRQSSRTRRLA